MILNSNVIIKIIFLISLFYSNIVKGQALPNVVPTPPQTTRFRVVTPSQSPTLNYRTPQIPTSYTNPNTRNQQQLAQYERDRQEVLQREIELKKLRAELEKRNSIHYTFPDFKNDASRQYYKQAFEKLNQLNPDNFSIKQANFIVENAYYDNSNNYNEYSKTITNSKEFIELAMKSRGIDPNNDLAKNLTIFQFMADTLKVGDLEHKPLTYDFEDFRGQKDWRKMLVQKLIEKGSGQCNSMPRLISNTGRRTKNRCLFSFCSESFLHNVSRFKK